MEIRGLRKSFEGVPLFQGLDLDIHRGEVLTLIGVSGCGKTVLLKALMGLIPMDAGTIHFDTERVSDLPEREWFRVRRRIGMLFQASALFDSLSVFENVAYALREEATLSEPEIAARVRESLAAVHLPGIEEMWPAALSGGMRKRVALARAIAVHPEMVLYDEPTEGLDPINVTRINRLLLGLRDRLGITTVIVTHNMESTFEISDRIALLDQGKVRALGSPEQLRASEDPLVRQFVSVLLEDIDAPATPSPPLEGSPS